MKTKKSKINPNQLKIRDRCLVALINGATKAAVHKDKKKEYSKKKCRMPADSD